MTSSAAAQEILAANTSIYLGEGKWEWTVFIQAQGDILKQIQVVEYTLHPTFPNPVVEVREPRSGPHAFALTRIGWGTFEISIKVTFDNGRVRTLKHMLTFVAEPVRRPLRIKADNIAEKLPDRRGRWEWTVFIQAPEDILGQIHIVEYTLHPTFPNPVVEVREPRSGPHAFALTRIGWGTFKLSIRVFLKDGRVQELTHNLKF